MALLLKDDALYKCILNQDDVAEWLRRVTRNHMGSPAQVQVLPSSTTPFYFCFSAFLFFLLAGGLFASLPFTK